MKLSRLVAFSFLFGSAACAAESPPVVSAPPPPPRPVAEATPPAPPATPPPPRLTPVERSDQFARLVVELDADFAPEAMTQLGVVQRDEAIVDMLPGVDARYRERTRALLAQLEQARAAETDPFVRQDLDIILAREGLEVRASELEERRKLDYEAIAKQVFSGIHALLDDQVSPERRAKAAVRLRHYAGLGPGEKPLSELAIDRFHDRLARGAPLVGPMRAEVDKDLKDEPALRKGIVELFSRYKISGQDDALAALFKELDAYDAFVRREVVPRTRTEARLPPDLYALDLERVGVDVAPADLAREARAAFARTIAEMDALAPEVARADGLPVKDRRGVLAALKKKQVSGEAVVPLYQARIHDLEAIIAREHLVSLPTRALRFRLASAAESVSEPAPHIDMQGVFGKGQDLVFVLPLRTDGGSDRKASGDTLDDFTYDAASWTLTAHEGRPGHDLQLSAVSERGLSLARKLFAFNSVNVEGWGLYAEYITRPFMPVDGRFVSLQALALREARAFLDPGIQLGDVTPAEARRVLEHDVGASHALASEELERFTFRNPGQAASYFYGYERMLALRAEVERAQGAGFNAARFHDFVLAEGLVPPALLARAVHERFLASK